jgi:lipopolysaccharide/colanic/teichoic acid biosynthesis glycosyltransferase
MSSIVAKHRWQTTIKRCLDLVITVPLLIPFVPLFAVVGLLIKWDSPGPVLYLDKRLGKDGKAFNCYKFRTMFTDSESVLEGHLDTHPDARIQWDLYKKLPHDPRVTRVGRLLRKMTLDESPQLVNIVLGEMSIVGPRPFMLREVQELEPYLAELLSVRPGMAGMWIAHGRNKLTFGQRIQLELQYVHSWSLRLDAVLLWKSALNLLMSRGAH